MLPIGDIISNGLGFLKELFGWKREDAARQNAPEMKAAAKGSTDQDLKDSAAKAIADHNAEEIARRLSE